ncbi:MAG: HupE/UreJ family protein [Planctomycetota bacterium]
MARPIHWICRFVFLLTFLTAPPAHVDTVSYLIFTIHEREIHVGVRVKAEYFTEPDAKAASTPSEIEQIITKAVRIDVNGKTLAASRGRIEYVQSQPSRGAEASRDIQFNCYFSASEVIEHIQIRYDLFRDHDPKHKGIAKIKYGIQEKVFIFRAGNLFESSIQDFEPAALAPAALAFFLLGMDHILSGLDHLLFLFGLLLAARTLKNLAIVITGFTIGHSVTLAGAALHWFSLAPAIVEPAIAASVVFVGIENIIRKSDLTNRWFITLLFGLIHGLGFAGFLDEVQLPADATILCLASFNIGVEAGQACIVCLLFPLLAWARQKNETTFRNYLFRPGSAAIAAAGLVWFVSRVG